MIRALLVALLGALPLAAEAQPTQVWASAGFGASLDTYGSGPSGRLGVQVRHGRWVGAARLSAYMGGPTDVDGLFGPARSTTSDAALLVGYAPRRWGAVQGVVAAGPALVWSEEVAGYVEPPCGIFGCSPAYERSGLRPGFAVEAGLYGRIAGPVGYGVVGHGTLAGPRPAGGVTLGLTLGVPR